MTDEAYFDWDAATRDLLNSPSDRVDITIPFTRRFLDNLCHSLLRLESGELPDDQAHFDIDSLSEQEEQIIQFVRHKYEQLIALEASYL